MGSPRGEEAADLEAAAPAPPVSDTPAVVEAVDGGAGVQSSAPPSDASLGSGDAIEEVKEMDNGGRRALGRTRLSFHEQDTHIPIEGGAGGSSGSMGGAPQTSKSEKKSVLKSLYSSVLGNSHASQLQRSLSNTLNFR
jgi:hypothetical protein